MEVKIIKDEKNELDIELDNLTVAELLRVYLNKNDVKMVAWKRDHPTKNPVLHIEADNPKKALKNSIAQIEKEIESALKEFKKLK
ncbi:MAG: RpoL/Rpb11 RNA polymerase subunit family protein [Candidatus Pacearchaeota archaeon]